MAIFLLSGLAGLIYQSIWSHYLGLTLGHAAYAQTLVLAIYMGGLALGSWIASRWAPTVRNAVLAYACVELVIGVCGFVFHPAFLDYTGFSQRVALPALPSSLVHAYQWGTAALLILPQCLLLGTTFPLMASACLRIEPEAQGRSLGGLYFTNSLGAALGALLATFVLLPWIGMPGAMAVAGATNVVVALLAWRLSRLPADAAVASVPIPPPAPAERGRASPLLAGVLLATAITGATSFVYEVVWVRMLNLALGSTLHSFELMLAAFILGLAAGAYWIHRRGDATNNTLRLAGVAQVLMGLCALASAVAFGQSFRWVGWLMKVLPRTDAGYDAFNLGSAAISLLVMFPTAFFAGSTLPLFTLSLLRRGEGERAVGRVYASNTLGAIIGVFAVVHVLIPWLGLHLSLMLAATMDIIVGIVLLMHFGAARAERDTRLSVFAAASMLAVAMLVGRIDPLVLSSGVYRSGELLQPSDEHVEFIADGKTATVSVFASNHGDAITIATNGKPDAGMSPSVAEPALADEVTMVMLGALPLALHPAPRDVAVIGWGSGLTTHTLLGSANVRSVETVEIEPAMVRGARAFGDRVQRAYSDPRSRIIYDDARTYFAAGRKQYDVLISEPSNPWVSGVASLFTEEFYGFAGRHLKPGGIFVQWLQSYEISDALQARMVAAMLKRFGHVDVYLANSLDLVLVASDQPLPPLDWRRVAQAPLKDELMRVGLVDPEHVAMRRLGGREVLEGYVRMYAGQVGHSDFYPEVALQAPRARFKSENALLLPQLAENGLPVLDMIDGRRVPSRADLVAWDYASSLVDFQLLSGRVNDALNAPAGLDPLQGWQHHDEHRAIERLREESRRPVAATVLPAWSRDLAVAARFGPGSLPTDELADTWVQPKWLAPGQGAEVSAVMAAYRAAAERDAPAMRTRALAVLDMGGWVSTEMREQMLVIAMAGAAGERDYRAVGRLSREHGSGLPDASEYARVRRFLVAWAERPSAATTRSAASP